MFLDRKTSSDTDAEVEKEKLIISLPFVRKYSNHLKKKLKALASTHLQSNFKISVVWSSGRKLRSFFPSKRDFPCTYALKSSIVSRAMDAIPSTLGNPNGISSLERLST